MFLVDDKSPQGGAALSAGAHSCEGAGLEGQFQVGVFVDDCCVVSAQLQQDPPEALLHLAPHDRTHPARPREGDQRDAVVFAHGLSDLRASLQDGEHVGVDVVLAEDLADDLGCGDGDEGGGGGALPGDRVSADEGDGRVPGEDRVGEVEGRDDTDSPDGVPDLHHEVVLSLGVEDLSSDGS